MRETPAAPIFELTGGALCLDFANTVADRPRFRQEQLHGYADLVHWGQQAEALSADQAERLRNEADAHPRPAARVFSVALELRERLYRIFSVLAAGDRPSARDLAALNQALAEAMGHARVEDLGRSFHWSWSGSAKTLDRMLWPVIRSAAELLTSEDSKRVRQCASARCSWLFVDRSRSRRRRWCDMKTCGNRAKARRHYQRKKQRRAQQRGD